MLIANFNVIGIWLWQEYSGSVLEKNTDEIAQMLGVKDPWYMRNVQSLFSLPPDVLCQVLPMVPWNAKKLSWQLI